MKIMRGIGLVAVVSALILSVAAPADASAAAWTVVPNSGAPTTHDGSRDYLGRFLHGMADDHVGRMILGVSDWHTEQYETWAWNGRGAWRMIRSEAIFTGPNPACDGEVMWDGASVVRVGLACLDRLVGTVWVPVEPRAVGLTAGSGRSTGYDPHRARLVQWTSNIVYTHTGAGWTTHFLSGEWPSQNSLPIEYDATNDAMLVVDSLAAGGPVTWLLRTSAAGMRWQRLTVATPDVTALVREGTSATVLGVGSGQTWGWNGTSWSARDTAPAYVAALGWDSRAARAVAVDEILVGCCDSIASTWVRGPD